MENKIKCDFNVHLDGNVNFQAVRHVLTLAEQNGVKAISLMEQNKLSLYSHGGVLHRLIKSGELEKFYTGKLISGCEITCVVNDTNPTKYAFNFNNHRIHLTLLNFDVERAENIKWFDKKFRAKCFKKDVKLMIKLLKKNKLEYPSKNYFVFGTKDILYQVYDFVSANPQRKKAYDNFIGEFSTPTSFVKNVFENPHSKLFFKQSSVPYLSEVLSFARKVRGRLYISHPHNMNIKFNTVSYLDALINMDTEYGFPFDGIEVYNSLNSSIDTKVLNDYAITHNLEISGGTNYRYVRSPQNPEGKILFDDNGDRRYVVPIPGTMIKMKFETHNGDLLLDKKFVDRMYDIREYPRFEVGDGSQK